MGRMSKEEKDNMMDKMMGKFFADMTAEDKQKMMEEMMPKMMENCLTPMSEEQRRNMLTFCRKMLGEMEERFLTSTQKGEPDS